MTTNYVSTADTAKMIRHDLKLAFPGVKVSVRSSCYSGGSSINVSWTLGPLTSEVDAVVGGYTGTTFDGMQDLKEIRAVMVDGVRTVYGPDHVFAERKIPRSYLDKVDAVLRQMGEASVVSLLARLDLGRFNRDFKIDGPMWTSIVWQVAHNLEV